MMPIRYRLVPFTGAVSSIEGSENDVIPIPTDQLVALFPLGVKTRVKRLIPYLNPKIRVKRGNLRVIYKDGDVVGSPLEDLLRFLLIEQSDPDKPRPWDLGLFEKQIKSTEIPTSLLSPSPLSGTQQKITLKAGQKRQRND